MATLLMQDISVSYVLFAAIELGKCCAENRERLKGMRKGRPTSQHSDGSKMFIECPISYVCCSRIRQGERGPTMDFSKCQSNCEAPAVSACAGLKLKV